MVSTEVQATTKTSLQATSTDFEVAEKSESKRVLQLKEEIEQFMILNRKQQKEIDEHDYIYRRDTYENEETIKRLNKELEAANEQIE